MENRYESRKQRDLQEIEPEVSNSQTLLSKAREIGEKLS